MLPSSSTLAITLSSKQAVYQESVGICYEHSVLIQISTVEYPLIRKQFTSGMADESVRHVTLYTDGEFGCIYQFDGLASSFTDKIHHTTRRKSTTVKSKAYEFDTTTCYVIHQVEVQQGEHFETTEKAEVVAVGLWKYEASGVALLCSSNTSPEEWVLILVTYTSSPELLSRLDLHRLKESFMVIKE